MAGIGKKILSVVLGVVAFIVIIEIKDRLGFGDKTETSTRVPDKLWDGGGAKITLKTECTERHHVHFMFSEAGDDGRRMEGREDLAAGTREFVIDVPKGASGTIDLGVTEPPMGVKARIEYWLDGKLMMADENTLTEPLREGWAFGVQISADDLSKGILEDGEQGGGGEGN